jgi:orotate phosphoribosyltransferase
MEMYGRSIQEQVLYWAKIAKVAGAQGIICSAQQLPFLKKQEVLEGMKFMTPGVRSPGAATHDQKQVATPAAAILNGADYLVIGREITESKDPVATIEKIQADVLAGMWQAAEGWYVCPKNSEGMRLGPLVGYAGTYKDGDEKKHFVGEVYFDFAAVEELPVFLEAFASVLAKKIKAIFGKPDWVLGAPMGGLFLTSAVARHLGCRALFAEKKVTKAAEGDQREESVLIFGRHTPEAGTWGVILEDVFNNFSTTELLLALIESVGAEARGMAGSMNRSDRTEFEWKEQKVGVVSALHRPTPQYRQDDAFVVKDITAGNVVWKAKPERKKLRQIMQDVIG